MAAVIGGTEEQARALAEACGVDIANLNAPGQVVLSGPAEGIRKAVASAKDHGARLAKPLKVAGAYHSRLMASAQEKLAEALAQAEIGVPSIPVLSNFTAAPVSTPGEIRETLTRQVTGSVRWSESMRLLLDQGHDLFIELGPGKVLAGLMARIDTGKQARVIAIEDAASLEQAAAELNG